MLLPSSSLPTCPRVMRECVYKRRMKDWRKGDEKEVGWKFWCNWILLWKFLCLLPPTRHGKFFIPHKHRMKVWLQGAKKGAKGEKFCCDLILLRKFVSLAHSFPSFPSFTPFFPFPFSLLSPLCPYSLPQDTTNFSSLGGTRAPVINNLLCRQLRPPPTFRTLSKKYYLNIHF